MKALGSGRVRLTGEKIFPCRLSFGLCGFPLGMHEVVADENYVDSIVSTMTFNDSRRAVVQAMVGEQPIVMTNGFLTLL